MLTQPMASTSKELPDLVTVDASDQPSNSPATSAVTSDPLQEVFGSLLHAKEVLMPQGKTENQEDEDEKSIQLSIQKLSKPTLPMLGSLASAFFNPSANVMAPRKFVLGPWQMCASNLGFSKAYLSPSKLCMHLSKGA